MAKNKGKVCINNEKQNKYVSKDEIHKYLAEGWYLGSKIK